ncbi:MAG: hypothetical protein ABIZ56_01770, partial [Chthoniobacteraceae bacterium]
MPRTFITLLALLIAIPLHAQTTRPGGAVRGTTGTNANRGTGGFGGGSGRSTTGGARQYRSNTELGDAMIQIDPETRSLVIVTDEETHEELMKVVRTIDQPKPQVLIKVVFVEVTYNKSLDVGVEANYTFNTGYSTGAKTGNQTTATTSTSTTGNTTTTKTSSLVTDLAQAATLANGVTGASVFSGVIPNPVDGTFARVLADDWSATLRLLATKGKVEVLSRPSIMARNNQEAVIVIGQEVPFITNSRTDNNGNIINTITYDNVGVILRVTPFITSEGTVEMIVAPEISSLTDQSVPIGNNASAPVISKRSAETVVVTPNGKTVVIGGLMQTQKIESIRKIPLLGDIPGVLGLPFRRTVRNDVKSELMIFLTPTIVNGRAEIDSVTAAEIAKNELVNKTYTQKDFDKYLDLPSLDPERDRASLPTRRATAVKTSVTVKPAPRATPAPAKTRATN